MKKFYFLQNFSNNGNNLVAEIPSGTCARSNCPTFGFEKMVKLFKCRFSSSKQSATCKCRNDTRGIKKNK